MAGNSSSNFTCVQSDYDSKPYLLVAGVRILAGLVALLLCFSLVGFFVYTKKQRRVINQHLVFCLALSSLLNSVGSLLSRIDFNERPLRDQYCLFAGPLQLYTEWTQHMTVLCISFNLLAQLTCQLPAGKKLKWVYYSLIFALPLVWVWTPFIEVAYGSIGPWCGIRALSDVCEPFLYGKVLTISLTAIPILVLLLTTSLFSLATWISLKQALHSFPQSTVDKTEVQAELKVLLWFPPLYPLLLIPLLVNTLYNTARPTSPQLALWLLQALTSPLAGAVTALLFGVNTETNTRARFRTWLTRHLCRCRAEQRERQASQKTEVSEYRCDLNVSYGDSMSGVMDRNRRERIRVNSSSPSQASSVVP